MFDRHPRAAAGTGVAVYTIKQVAALTGVAEATLRAWERRYGVVEPARSGGGYRQYDDAQVSALREMATLVANGVPASVAATVVTDIAGSQHTADRVDHALAAPADGIDLVGAAASLDPQRLGSAIDDAFTRSSFEQVVEGWLLPQLAPLGEAWRTGRLSVAQEHFASAGLMRAISTVYDAAPNPATGAAVLVGLPSGARHELALFCFAACLRRLGSTVVYLGADVPEQAWREAAQRRRARAAVLGVTAEREVPPAQAVADLLATVVPPLSVWVGGSRRDAVRRVRHLPDSVVSAARVVHQNLLAGGT